MEMLRNSIFGKLYVQVLIGVALGIYLGYADPSWAIAMKPFGDGFIKAIKVVVTPVIFTTIVVGIATMGDMRKIASVGLKTLIYFEIVTTLALIVGMVVGNYWPVGTGINANPANFDPKAVADYVASAKNYNLTDFLLNIIPTTFIDGFVKGEIIQVLFVAVLFGLGLAWLGERSRPLTSILDQVSHGLFGMVRIIMFFAPLGAFGAMSFTIGKFGIKTLLSLGELIAAVYLVSFLFIVFVFGSVMRICGLRLSRVLAFFKDELVFVFAATSAETMIPRSMEKLERMGCKKEVIGLVMPTGFSFNMDGTAIYMTIGTLFIAHACNIELSLWQQFIILFVMLFTSKGAAGVTGGGFVALAATLPALGGLLPIGGLTLLVGVDRFMAECRAVTNLLSNIVATIVIARWTGSLDMARAKVVLNGKDPNELAVTDMGWARGAATNMPKTVGLGAARG
ncbi:MAG TPA: C4-dicarboxylate transporter DctA [Xanthobacteraceae bacterium]|nr:C4-dicarboxylate transporter DctA [Xanthobacteraceae bacterium]